MTDIHRIVNQKVDRIVLKLENRNLSKQCNKQLTSDKIAIEKRSFYHQLEIRIVIEIAYQKRRNFVRSTNRFCSIDGNASFFLPSSREHNYRD